MTPPFDGRTGRGVRIAIIDSGVHPGHDHIRADQIEPGVAIRRGGGIEGGQDATLDRLGHGTAVTAAIQEKAPDAFCLPIRVFHEGLKASAMALITAIAWAVEQRADIINLSLGSTNRAHAPAFTDVVERACEAGVAIIAPDRIEEQPCYPGAISGVFAVGLDWDCPRGHFRLSQGGGRFLASGYPRAIPGVPLRRNLYGISFATAQLTGFAACALEGVDRDFTGFARIAALKTALRANAA
ncbi:S8 family serine peptidase [Sphingobium sp. Sx8-8]|uniref:subtilisin-like serine protease QhpE n=1 Tax=Sphingobium sp. Sx8-8 TaxID=2933617 RepID=UPI001F55AD4C